MMSVLFVAAPLGLLATWLLTGALRGYALRTQMIDHPNARSSHTVPTPRGGGLAIVLTLLTLSLGLWLAEIISDALLFAVIGSGSLIAALGFLDDRRPLPARLRFCGHVAAAGWVIWWIGPLPDVPVFGHPVPLAWPGLVLAAGYIVWSINLVNFMDGIDGIASVEIITLALGGAVIWALFGSSREWGLAVVLAACVGGFLIWNYPPARIFMGDAGSGFLGLLVATLTLWCGQDTPTLFWSWFILGGVFMVDATTTLIRRVLRGERFHEAHRSHAYQYASRHHGSHRVVSLAVGAINVVWLLPLALLVAAGRLDGAAGTIVAFAPLVWLAYRYKAGDAAAQAA